MFMCRIFRSPSGWHMIRMKEGNILFNDTLNTFYLRLHGVRHTVKDLAPAPSRPVHYIYNYMINDYWATKKGNLLLPLHRLLFSISIKACFICIIPQTIYISFLLGKMIGTVRSWTSFILSSQSWETGSPPTGGAGKMKLSCVVPASVIHIWPIHTSWGKIHLCVSTCVGARCSSVVR